MINSVQLYYKISEKAELGFDKNTGEFVPVYARIDIDNPDGYSATDIKEFYENCKNPEILQSYNEIIAKQAGIPVEYFINITKDEYLLNIDNKEELEYE